MRSFQKLAALTLAVTLPFVAVACGDDDDNPGNTGGSSNIGGDDAGGSAGEGGSSQTGGSNQTGGTSGSGGSSGEAGSGTAGGEPGVGGEAGGGNVPVECDLSGNGLDRVDIESPITDTVTLTNDKVWVLNGTVEVQDGGVLEIPACTRIEGTKSPVGALMVERGGKIKAMGEKDAPVLFTSQDPVGSREAGGWGGVILLGKAKIAGFDQDNTEAGFEGFADNPNFFYGGDDDEDSSGELHYVRIEFGGYKYLADKEVNGLSMAGVGSGTKIDHVMVSHNLDDCFEWWGGTVEATELICNNAGDDMFDGDAGWRGGGKNWFGRTTSVDFIDSDDPNGFEWDGFLNGNSPATDISAENVTLCATGEEAVAVNKSYGMVLRELVNGSISNVQLSAFEVGVDTRDPFGTAENPHVTISDSSFFNLVDGVGAADATDNDDGFDEEAWFLDGDGNSAPDTAPFENDDCINPDGPTEAVTDSETGAFTEGADWIDGKWVDWSED